MSLFSKIPQAPPIEVLDMKRRHDEDKHEKKINLTVGGYKVKFREKLLDTSHLNMFVYRMKMDGLMSYQLLETSSWR